MSTQLPSISRTKSLRFPFSLRRTSLGLWAIVLLAAVLRLANIDAIGQSNTYYTAAVESMLQSWHNFFFVAAEPGGSVSVDKPPVGLWIEVLSAYLLGVSGFATVLPQILAGIGSVILLHHLVRRSFGDGAGLLSALVLAVTPVMIAVERNNTQDATLIFTLLLAAWAFIKATETRRLRFLILGAVLIGIGFNIKMMQVLLPVPALYALYFFGSQQRWWRKLGHLGLATLVLIPVALSWAVIVDLTPADQRPYVGSSGNNSALNLIVGYNGIQRLVGIMGGSRQRLAFPPGGMPAPSGRPQANVLIGPGAAPGGPGGSFGTGSPGVLRMFQIGLAAQASWLLPFALTMLVAMAASVSWRRPQTELHRGLFLWGGWLLTCAIFFSVAGFFHQYYLAMLGPPLAAIVALGLMFLWHLRTSHPLRAALLLLLAAVVTLAFQSYAVSMYMANPWWVAVPLGLGGIGLGLFLLRARHGVGMLPRVSFGLVIAALLIVPTVWSCLTTAYADTSSPLTQAYTGNLGRFGMGGPPNGAAFGGAAPAAVPGGDMGGAVNQTLLDYLQANTQDTKYLIVVPSANVGAAYVLATSRPVLYAGGFSGSDPVIDGDDLARLVASGDVRYVLWGGGGGPGGGPNPSISQYVQSACSVVTEPGLGTPTSSAPSTDRPPAFPGGRGGPMTLYRCGS
ncbi:MAG TPA: glycosyltransferase family 39 protein [Herpetosiphonaceae bacterium]